jgi:geranylgeranyl pyrophosphate synthase
MTQPGEDASQRSPVHLPTILQMEVSEVEKQLEAIRERRLKAVRKLEEQESVARHKSLTASKIRFESMIEKARKQLTKIDAQIDKLELLVFQVRALQLELDD